jgi:hypothetical protein
MNNNTKHFLRATVTSRSHDRIYRSRGISTFTRGPSTFTWCDHAAYGYTYTIRNDHAIARAMCKSTITLFIGSLKNADVKFLQFDTTSTTRDTSGSNTRTHNKSSSSNSCYDQNDASFKISDSLHADSFLFFASLCFFSSTIHVQNREI